MGLAVALAAAGSLGAARKPASGGPPGAAELRRLADDAYVFGYPLMLFDQTRRQLTRVTEAGETAAPINQMARSTRAPGAADQAVVRPNVDTLYLSAFLDVGPEPVVLHLPDTHGRYYLMPLLDAYTNVFASPGTRTTSRGPHDLAIVGPGWTGSLPHGVKRIAAPTRSVWMIGRIEVRGAKDRARVARLARDFTLVPLHAFGRPYTPPPGPPVRPAPTLLATPPERLAAQDDASYFQRLAALLAENPPPPRDLDTMGGLARLGIIPGRFDPPDDARAAMQGAGRRGLARMRARAAELGTLHNGWRGALDLGEYGTRYLERAAVALVGLGANLPEDAVYWMRDADSEGRPLDGRRANVLHFERGQLPPTSAFWSLTLYDPQGYLVSSPIDRHAIGHTGPLVRNPNGSVTLDIQHGRPFVRRGRNWLPAPAGHYNLVLRVYWPKRHVLDGRWQPPPVRPVLTPAG
jgi:hypothetical protein